MRALFSTICVIIIYGSLFPFDFYWPNFEQFSWLDWTLSLEERTTNGDRLSNLLTFIPLGFFAYFYNPLNFRRFATRSISILLICLFIAYCLQVLQIFTPHRVPSVGDVFYNLWGVIFGIAGAASMEKFLNKKAELADIWFSEYSVVSTLVLLAVLYFLFPFFFQIDIDDFIQSAQPIWTPPWIIPELFVLLLAYWLSFLTLLKYFFWNDFSYSRLTIIISILLILKIISAHNFIDLNWIFAASLSLVLIKYSPRCWIERIVLVMLVVALILPVISPWKVKMLSGEFNWMPLNSYLNGSLWLNTQLFLEKIFLFGSLLFFTKRQLGSWLIATAACAGLVFVVEILQLFISLGQASVTEPLMVVIIGWIFVHLEKSKLTLKSTKHTDIPTDASA